MRSPGRGGGRGAGARPCLRDAAGKTAARSDKPLTTLPLRDWLGFAVASLHLSPSIFWGMSVRELLAAVDRWNAEQGGEPDDPLLGDDLAELMRLYPD